MNINTHVPNHQPTSQTFLNPHTQYNLPTHHEISQWDASTCQSSTHGCISLVLPIVCCQPIRQRTVYNSYTCGMASNISTFLKFFKFHSTFLKHRNSYFIPKMSLQGSKFHEPYFYKKCHFRGPNSRFVGDEAPYMYLDT